MSPAPAAPLSPNFAARRGGVLPDLIVIHYTGMASCATALARLCDPAAEVSAHYLIAESGQVLALVDEDQRAWHAGAGSWGNVADVNSRSIGIELANDGAQPFPHPQMTALERMLAGVMARWRIAPHRVIGHSDMAPGRKADPGPRFDWRRLSASGLSVWPSDDATAASGVSATRASSAGAPDLAASARVFGYPDAAPELLLAAVRLRFRPWATGPEDQTDRALIADLARRFPCDPPLGG